MLQLVLFCLIIQFLIINACIYLTNPSNFLHHSLNFLFSFVSKRIYFFCERCMASGTANTVCLCYFLLFISRLEKVNAQVVTRSRSGSVVPKTVGDVGTPAAGTGTTGKLEIVSGKATPEEIKEKMEQQLKMQRAAHQQKRALETLKVPGGQVFKMVPTTQQGECMCLYCTFSLI